MGIHKTYRCMIAIVCVVCWQLAGAHAQGGGGAETPTVAESVSAPVVVEVGDLGSPGIEPLKWLDTEADLFRKAHPEIELRILADNPSRRTEQPLQDKPRLAENVMGIRSWTGDETAYLANQGLIVPLDEFMAKSSVNRSVFFDRLWEPVSFGGKTWGLPWVVRTPVLVCNRRLLKEAGFEAPPTTWQDLARLGHAATKDTNGDGTVDQWGVGMRREDVLGFTVLTMTYQKSGSIVHDGVYRLTDESYREALDYWRELTTAGVLKIRDVDVSRGTCAAQLMFSRDVNDFYRSRDVVVSPVPTEGEAVWVGGNVCYLAIRKSTPERERASWAFLEWVARPDAHVEPVWWGCPCRIDAPKRADFHEAYKDFCPGYEDMLSAVAGLTDVATHFTSRDPALKTIGLSMLTYIQGGGSFSEIMSSAEARANEKSKMVLPEEAELHGIFK